MELGPARFVDATKGSDSMEGSEASPWQSLKHALRQLEPGQTLYLRGGIYHEHVTVSAMGTAEAPITIRSYPGELAILDGGVREFFVSPEEAWEPWPEGCPDEYRSVNAYPGLADGVVLGNFGDSMVPLHGYRDVEDLRSSNGYWIEKGEQGMYCGPGLWYDTASGHIHVRLAHTNIAQLDEAQRGWPEQSAALANYRGETDPRRLPLVVGGAAATLRIAGAKYVRIQDLVVRGSNGSTIEVENSERIELDGVTAYGGARTMTVSGTTGLRLIGCAFSGISAPWSSRGSLKYHGVPAYLLWITPSPPNHDIEIAYCELTDSHDGPFIGPAKGLKFHHNLVDNHNDDGIYLTAMGVGGDIHIYQNRLSRCLAVFSFFGDYPVGSGVWIYRNLIDLRPPVAYGWPKSPDDDEFLPQGPGRVFRRWTGHMCGEHGGPTWEPIYFYHNTVLADSGAYMKHVYGLGWGWHTSGTVRHLFNNIFVQVEGTPSLTFRVRPEDDLKVDGNLHWGLVDGPAYMGDYFAEFRKSSTFEASKRHYPDGWGAHDAFGDPKFAGLTPDWRNPVDIGLLPGSRAIDAGIELPPDWPDPLRQFDERRPDAGCLPLGTEMWPVGPSGQTAPGS